MLAPAWPIDFALKLASFEPQIRGVRALVDFALTAPTCSKPPQIQYISSVGVFQGGSHNPSRTSVLSFISVTNAFTRWTSRNALCREAGGTERRSSYWLRRVKVGLRRDSV